MIPDAQRDYWDLLAHKFQHQQPPLRPGTEDVQIFQRMIGGHCSQRQRPQTNVLMLGVTPEIANLAWPPGTQLLAVEKSQPMIDLVWPGNIPDWRKVVHENWFNLRLADRSQDIVIGDGVLTAFAWPDRYQLFARVVSRWLKPDGRLMIRAFSRKRVNETLEGILADLHDQRIPRFDILKWRLAMMLQPSVREGVTLDSVHRAWETLERQYPRALAATGWPAETIATIRLYADRTQRYTFPLLEEVAAAFAPYLEVESIVVPRYELGDCCPILVYRLADDSTGG